MGKIRIMADSACDLDPALLASLGVELFNIPVAIQNTVYHDRLDISPAAFYKLLEEHGSTPESSPVPLECYVERFRRIVNESDDTAIYIALSSKLSTCYESAIKARDGLDISRLTVVDSSSASAGCGLLVIQAAEAVQAGMSHDEVLACIYEDIGLIQHVMVLGDYEMLKRGGRASETAAAIGNLLNIKLIWQLVDGQLRPIDKAQGMVNARKCLLEIIEERGYELQNQLIGISFSVDYNEALEVKKAMEEQFGCERFIITEMGAAIGSHVGAGSLGVFFRGLPNHKMIISHRTSRLTEARDNGLQQP